MELMRDGIRGGEGPQWIQAEASKAYAELSPVVRELLSSENYGQGPHQVPIGTESMLSRESHSSSEVGSNMYEVNQLCYTV